MEKQVQGWTLVKRAKAVTDNKSVNNSVNTDLSVSEQNSVRKNDNNQSHTRTTDKPNESANNMNVRRNRPYYTKYNKNYKNQTSVQNSSTSLSIPNNGEKQQVIPDSTQNGNVENRTEKSSRWLEIKNFKNNHSDTPKEFFSGHKNNKPTVDRNQNQNKNPGSEVKNYGHMRKNQHDTRYGDKNEVKDKPYQRDRRRQNRSDKPYPKTSDNPNTLRSQTTSRIATYINQTEDDNQESQPETQYWCWDVPTVLQTPQLPEVPHISSDKIPSDTLCCQESCTPKPVESGFDLCDAGDAGDASDEEVVFNY